MEPKEIEKLAASIVKVKDYDNENGMTASEAEKELAKRNLRTMTEQEWMALPAAKIRELYPYTPVFLGRRKDGLLLRGYDGFGDDWRVVFAYCRGGRRFGVVGVPIGKKGKHKHEWKCDCGAMRKV